MAQYVSGNLGNLALSVPNDGVNRFSYYWSEDVLRDPHYYDNQFKILGQNIGELFNEVKNSDVGLVINIATLKDGKYIGAKVTSVYRDDNYNNLQIWCTMQIYNADGSLFSNKLVWQYAFMIRAYLINGFIPLYPIVYVDEEAKTATFFIFNGDRHSDGKLRFWNYQGAGKTSSDHFTASEFYNIIKGNVKEYDPDPWSSGGYGDIGGGDGDLDLSSDVIALPDLPISVTSTGFIQLYNPTFKQINELSDYMWGDGFFDNVLKLWNDPMDIIINLAQFPISIPTAGTQYVTAGNVITNVEMNYPSNQYVELDCGELEVKHFYDAYIDYEPYTTCEIFLPYVGTELLSMDDIMGKTLSVKYRIDLMTGGCTVFILCNNILLYTFNGACSINIPVSGQNFSGIANAVIGTVTAGAVAKGAGVTSKGAPIPSSKPGAVASSLASNVMSCKPTIGRSGTITSNTGILGPQKPYLIFTVPRSCLPKGQNKYLGYPAFMTVKLSELKGYTEIASIRLNNISCTELEKKEIEDLLKGGVIL